MPDQSINYGGITTSCYENEVPDFVEAEMERLYENLFSSIAQFRIYGATAGTNTYVARENGRVIAIFLFRMTQGKVQVINEVIRIESQEIARFTDYIFYAFPSVSVISFKAIETDLRKFHFPYQRINFLEDIVLTLPPTVDDYFAKLGKATRKTIKGYMNKMKRAFPTFRHDFYSGDAVSEHHIREIIQMNKARMAGKNKVSAYDEHETRRIVSLARQCGLVGVASIDGRACAGTISFRVGSNYFMRISAHDAEYDDFRLGTISGFLAISECILRGGRECHLLWGQHEYKYRFLGVRRDLDNIAVYRSWMYVLRYARMALRMTCMGYMRRAALRLHEEKRLDSVVWRMAAASSNFVNSLKRFGVGFSIGRK